MTHRPIWPAAVAGMVISAAVASAQETAKAAYDGDVPLAPIAARDAFGLTNIFRLRNAWISAAVAPDAGRIVWLASDPSDVADASGNLFRLDTDALARAPGATDEGDWLNVGGDWLWPVAQSRWPAMQQGDWPPPSIFRNSKWKAQAWENVDGAKCCLLSQEFGAPLHIRVSRLVRVDPRGARIDIRQRILRLATSSVPVCLWQISQVAGASRVVLPTDETSAFPGGYRVVAFNEPGPEMITRDGDAIVLDLAQGTEHKIGSDSKRGWIAAQKGETLILEYATGGDAGGAFPDGGCRTTLYANRGLGYAEIETMSVERDLAQGERLDNTVTIELHKVATNATPAELIAKIRQARGEAVAAPVTAP